MKAIYYFLRGVDSLKNHGAVSTCRSVLQFFWYLGNRWLHGRTKIRAMLDELAGLPQQTTVEEVFSSACSLGQGIIAPMQDRNEFESLLQHVFGRNSIKTVLEIGTCGGGSLFCFCRMAAPDALVISVDLPGGFFGGGAPAWKQRLFKGFVLTGQRLHLLRLNSHDRSTYERVQELLAGKKLDFLFIDGDHTFEGVKQDFEMYSPLVRPGGFVGFHDTLNDAPIDTKEFGHKIGVGRYWRSLRDRYRHWDFEHSGTIGIGLLQLP